MGVSGGGGSSASKRGRPYGVMLILAVTAAVFAVMLLHKMRERRIFNILISEKEHNLLTLQLLLQKERESAKEMKKKIEELKSKARFLKTQKIELNDKLMEMEAIASSLREERRNMESALDERLNEIKVLREKERDSSKDAYQITSLQELLRLKEAEIKEMKDQLQTSSNVLLASTGDSSKPPRNLTGNETGRNGDNAYAGERQTKGTLNSNNEAVTTEAQVSSKIAFKSLEHKEIPTEASLQRQKNNQDVDEGPRERGESGNKKAENSQVQGEISNPQNGSDIKEEAASRFSDGILINKNEGSNHSTPQGIASKALGVSSNGGMKFEEPERSQKVLSSRLKEKNSRRSTLGGKKRKNSRDEVENSEDGARDTLRVKPTTDRKLKKGKLWKAIDAGRRYKERTNAYIENSNPNRSENWDFAYKGDQTLMDAAADYDDDN
ncbi:hypothetical protein Scep_011155 [Stephania cephalantha]|uniref:Uncharacterized protein n=1 Tax=Stephania cephalantha TaxID=152367 RepID=A0AAP0JEU6_9MAGN